MSWGRVMTVLSLALLALRLRGVPGAVVGGVLGPSGPALSAGLAACFLAAVTLALRVRRRHPFLVGNLAAGALQVPMLPGPRRSPPEPARGEPWPLGDPVLDERGEPTGWTYPERAIPRGALPSWSERAAPVVPPGARCVREVRDGRVDYVYGWRARSAEEPDGLRVAVTSIGTTECWTRAGEEHHPSAPARVTLTFEACVEAWCRDGRVHRDDGRPAEREGPPAADAPTRERWRLAGRPARGGGLPTSRALGEDGTATETWTDELGWPAREVRLRLDGTRVEVFWRDGVPHRDGGPAATVSRPDGTVVETWIASGRVRSPDGSPARRVTLRDGTEEHLSDDGIERQLRLDGVLWTEVSLDEVAEVRLRYEMFSGYR